MSRGKFAMENIYIVEELKRQRASGVKNKDLAAKLGCSPGFLSEVISGKKQAGRELSDSLEQMIRDSDTYQQEKRRGLVGVNGTTEHGNQVIRFLERKCKGKTIAEQDALLEALITEWPKFEKKMEEALEGEKEP